MRPISLKVLTWATMAAAVVSALWLAAGASDPVATLRVTALPASLVPLPRLGEPGPDAGARGRSQRPAPVQPRRPH